MTEFRKKPVVITALQVPAMGVEPSEALAELVQSQDWEANDDGIVIPTLEGNHLASPLDWIIRGVAGEYYPCKPDIFEATYDDASNPVAEPEYVAELRADLKNSRAEAMTATEDAIGAVSEAKVTQTALTEAYSERDQSNEELASMRVILADNLAEIKGLNADLSNMKSSLEFADKELSSYIKASKDVETSPDCDPDEQIEKTLHNSTVSGARKNVSDLNVVGNGDAFQLLCKASSKAEGWMKSTKAMQFPGGDIVQVSTQQRNPDGSYAVAEAITFVPMVKIADDENGGRKLVGR